MDTFTVVMHHMGMLMYEPWLYYDDKEIHAFPRQDIDMWSFFYVVSLLKSLGYDEKMKFRQRVENEDFKGNLKPFLNDTNVMELAKFALSNKGDVAVYVEHTMSTIECIEQLDNGTVSGKKQENGEDGKNMDVGVFNEIGKWEDANDDVGLQSLKMPLSL